jgi:hypothetical protein
MGRWPRGCCYAPPQVSPRAQHRRAHLHGGRKTTSARCRVRRGGVLRHREGKVHGLRRGLARQEPCWRGQPWSGPRPRSGGGDNGEAQGDARWRRRKRRGDAGNWWALPTALLLSMPLVGATHLRRGEGHRL